MHKISLHKVFWLLTITVFIGLTLPFLIQDGMFLDGVTYSSIANNLANNIGSFWKPHYTQTLYSEFYEHPPLVYGIHSLFYKVFGNSIYIDRLYSFITGIISLIGITFIWKLSFKKTQFESYSWLPVIFWIMTPIVSWSIKNNMLENTVTLFIIFSIYFMLKSILTRKLIYLFIGTYFTLFAFLSKGPVGLFPLAAIIIYWISHKSYSIKNTVAYSILSLTILVSLSLALFIIEPTSFENISTYLKSQLFASIEGNRETTGSRFYLLSKILLELLLPLILVLIFYIKNYYSSVKKNINWEKALFFILIGISASLPLVISPKQHGYYLVPAIPFYCIGLSIILLQLLQGRYSNISSNIISKLQRLSLILLLMTIILSFSFLGKYSRDKDKLHDIYIISNIIPKGTIISTSIEYCKEWELIAYLSRIGNISLEYTQLHDYYLTGRNSQPDQRILNNYNEILISKLFKYRIFYKKKPVNTIK